MSDTPTTHPAALSTLSLAMLGGLVLVLISGFIVLTLTGHPVTEYVLFVAGPLVTTVTAALIGQRVNKVADDVKVVEAQTNGLLSARLTDLHTHLDEQTRELLPEPPATVVGPPSSASSSPLPMQAPPAAAEQRR